MPISELELRAQYDFEIHPLSTAGLLQFFNRRMAEEIGETTSPVPYYVTAPSVMQKINGMDALSLLQETQNHPYEYLLTLTPYHIIRVRSPTPVHFI